MQTVQFKLKSQCRNISWIIHEVTKNISWVLLSLHNTIKIESALNKSCTTCRLVLVLTVGKLGAQRPLLILNWRKMSDQFFSCHWYSTMRMLVTDLSKKDKGQYRTTALIRGWRSQIRVKRYRTTLERDIGLVFASLSHCSHTFLSMQ